MVGRTASRRSITSRPSSNPVAGRGRPGMAHSATAASPRMSHWPSQMVSQLSVGRRAPARMIPAARSRPAIVEHHRPDQSLQSRRIPGRHLQGDRQPLRRQQGQTEAKKAYQAFLLTEEREAGGGAIDRLEQNAFVS